MQQERSSAVKKGLYASFLVQMPSDTKQVDVFGENLGDLREAVKRELKVPHFQQNLAYLSASGDPVALVGDDSTPMKEKPGLLDAKELMLSRQVDPRLKMEKQTAFLEALATSRFADAKEMLEDASGVAIDPNCVLQANVLRLPREKGRRVSIGVTECPMSYKHPAITVAMIAGLEYTVQALRCLPDAIQEWMSREQEVCEVVALLIQQEADVNATGDETLDAESAGAPPVDGKSPLCAAIQRGSPTLVKMLLDAKADPNHTVHLGGSAWGPGPGAQLPDAFLNEICNGSMSRRKAKDPRNKYDADILELLRVSRSVA